MIMIRRRQPVSLLVTASLSAFLVSSASLLPLVAQAAEETVILAQVDQTRLNQTNGNDAVVQEYRAAIDKLDDLREYNSIKRAVVEDQENRIVAMNDEITKVGNLKTELPPMIEEMIQNLETFIESDIPHHRSERADRLENIRTVASSTPDPDEGETEEAKIVELFHKTIEAYQIENDYGRAIETEEGTITSNDQPLDVDFLMIGRVALYYQVKDGTDVGMWDQEAGAWNTELSSSAADQIRNALLVAKEAVPPDLLVLPLPAPEDA